MALALGLIIGFVTGTLFGVVLMAALAVSHTVDDEMNGAE